MKTIKLFLVFISLICFSHCSTNKNHKNYAKTMIQNLQKHVVSIRVRSPISAYSQEGTSTGSGCIVDSSGIIATCAHVAVSDAIARYEVTLFDGRECEASLIYSDPWLDIAFLKINENDLPEPALIGINEVSIGDKVTVVGKNENMNFSTHTGTIANPYESITPLPSQVFRISLSAQGGASGSPVFNSKGEVVGIMVASDTLTSGFAYPIIYIKDFLKNLKDKTPIKRRGLGIVLEYVSCDAMSRYHSLPKEQTSEYRKKFPKAFNRMLMIKQILPNSKATSILEIGDVIISANGEDIGPSMYLLDKIISSCDEVLLKIQRKDKTVEIKAKTEDLFLKKIKKLVVFGGAVFYEADYQIIRRTGAKENLVFVTNIKPGSSFFEKLPVLPRTSSTLVSIQKIGNFEIKNLEDLINAIPNLLKQNDFPVYFKNYGLEIGFNQSLFFNQCEQTQGISYMRQDGLPEFYVWNDETYKFEVNSITG